MSDGVDPLRRNEKTIPRCEPRNHLAADVAVSSEGAPGAGVNWACGSGGGGGRILTGLLGTDATPPEAIACTGPVCASIGTGAGDGFGWRGIGADRKSTRLNSSHMSISYAVFCLKKKKN